MFAMFVLSNILLTYMDVESLYQLIGTKIREARERAGLSQAKLAQSLGMSRASVVNIEAGRQRPPVHILWQIAEKLGTETALLIPKQREYDEQTQPVSLEPEFFKKIEEAASGDSATKRDLVAFISKIKSRTEN